MHSPPRPTTVHLGRIVGIFGLLNFLQRI
jgi:hypothetical protein